MMKYPREERIGEIEADYHGVGQKIYN